MKTGRSAVAALKLSFLCVCGPAANGNHCCYSGMALSLTKNGKTEEAPNADGRWDT